MSAGANPRGRGTLRLVGPPGLAPDVLDLLVVAGATRLGDGVFDLPASADGEAAGVELSLAGGGSDHVFWGRLQLPVAIAADRETCVYLWPW